MSDREDGPTEVRKSREDGDTVPDGAGDATDGTPDEAIDPDASGPDATGPDVTGSEATDPDDVPVWEDEYLERVSNRLMYNFDLEKDRQLEGETFPLAGTMEMHTQKHFLHPALSYAEHEATEYLFARRVESVAVRDLERYVSLAHDLADEWIEADEEHYSTDFSFALVAPRIPESVREFVTGFDDRTLLKYGYFGHYEVNLVVVAPDAEAIAASRSTDLDRAFAVWQSAEAESPGLLDRLF